MNNERITVVDTLRGFALLGIMLLHSIEHFDFFWPAELNPVIFHRIDPWVDEIISMLFSGKAYSIFSIMFGFSFFIQMNRAENRGIDYRLRFIWRLVLLFILGYGLSLFYAGQILVIYAIMGLPLILFYRWNRKWLIALAVILMLQIPTLINLVQSYLDPNFMLHRNFGRGLWKLSFQTIALGSFSDVVHFNLWKGHMAAISWSYYNGRYLQLSGLFIVGLLMGKDRFFEKIDHYKKPIQILFFLSLFLFVLLYTLLMKIPEFNITSVQLKLYRTLLKSYSGLALTTTYICGIIYLYQHSARMRQSLLLANYGRMSLTNYTLQPLIGAPLFYGYGLALFRYFGPTLSLFYGVIFLIFQLWFSSFWMKRFYYGPFEWLWRSATFFNFKMKFKKSNQLMNE